MDERRQHPRFSLDVTVEVSGAGHGSAIEGTMRNVSDGGAFLRLPGRLPQGSRINVLVPGDDGQLTSLPATVCRVALNGVGIAWDEGDDDRKRFIEALVERAKPAST